VAVRLVEARPITGGLTLQLIEDEAAADERIAAAGPAAGHRRKQAAGRSPSKRPSKHPPRRARRGRGR